MQAVLVAQLFFILMAKFIVARIKTIAMGNRSHSITFCYYFRYDRYFPCQANLIRQKLYIHFATPFSIFVLSFTKFYIRLNFYENIWQ